MRLRILLAVLFLLPQLAAAAASVRVVETYPAGTSLGLPGNQSYYLRLRYQSDEPVKLWVRPYFRGQPAKAGSNPSLTHPAGSGETMGWFFLMKAGDAVDEIRIEGGDGSVNGTRELLRLPVNIVGVPSGGTRPVEPEWGPRIRATEAALAEQERARAVPVSGGSGGAAVATGFMIIVLLVLVLSVAWPWRAMRRWQGGWRIAAMVPLAVTGFVVLRILFGVLLDPTSHNLWPFEVALAGVVSVMAMAVFVVLRWMTGVREG
jgi:hypothetical protein